MSTSDDPETDPEDLPQPASDAHPRDTSLFYAEAEIGRYMGALLLAHQSSDPASCIYSCSRTLPPCTAAVEPAATTHAVVRMTERHLIALR